MVNQTDTQAYTRESIVARAAQEALYDYEHTGNELVERKAVIFRELWRNVFMGGEQAGKLLNLYTFVYMAIYDAFRTL